MRKLWKKMKNKQGFTLMEMLIVVAIIGILIAIMIPTFSNALTKARISADEANLRSYYATTITDHMLNETTLDATTIKGDGKSVTIDGTKYTLQAGSFDVTLSADGETFTITYTPTNAKYDKVTIPGGATTEQGK